MPSNKNSLLRLAALIMSATPNQQTFSKASSLCFIAKGLDVCKLHYGKARL